MSNDYLPFATAVGATPMSQTDYAASQARLNGVAPGIADPTLYNKSVRQASVVSSAIAQFIADTLNINVVDDGNVGNFETLFEQALTIYAAAPASSSLVHGGTDTGQANAINVSVMPKISLLQADTVLVVFPKYASIAASAQNPATITINNTGSNALTAQLLRGDGTPIQSGDYGTGPTIFITDGQSWYLAQLPQLAYTAAANGGLAIDPSRNASLSYTNLVADPRSAPAGADGFALRRSDTGAIVYDTMAQLLAYIVASNNFQQLVANPTLFVRTDGNDANDGLANSSTRAFKTIAAAIAAGVSKYNFATTSLTIQLGIPGTYACPASFPNVPGLVNIQGDPANQDAYILTSPGNQGSGCFNANGAMHVVGVQIQNTGNISATVTAGGGAQLTLFTTSIVGTTSNPNAQVLAAYGGTITFAAGCKVQGSAAAALQSIAGYINIDANLTLVGTPAFSTATAAASKSGQIAFFGGSISGSATGPRYNASAYGIIDTVGGGPNFIPGSTAGTATTGMYS